MEYRISEITPLFAALSAAAQHLAEELSLDPPAVQTALLGVTERLMALGDHPRGPEVAFTSLVNRWLKARIHIGIDDSLYLDDRAENSTDSALRQLARNRAQSLGKPNDWGRQYDFLKKALSAPLAETVPKVFGPPPSLGNLTARLTEYLAADDDASHQLTHLYGVVQSLGGREMRSPIALAVFALEHCDDESAAADEIASAMQHIVGGFGHLLMFLVRTRTEMTDALYDFLVAHFRQILDATALERATEPKVTDEDFESIPF